MSAPDKDEPEKGHKDPLPKRDVLKELIQRIDALQALADVERKQGTFPMERETTRRTTEAILIMAECAVHGLGLLAESTQYQRVQAETAAITLQMKQMQSRPLQMPPGLKLG